LKGSFRVPLREIQIVRDIAEFGFRPLRDGKINLRLMSVDSLIDSSAIRRRAQK